MRPPSLSKVKTLNEEDLRGLRVRDLIRLLVADTTLDLTPLGPRSYWARVVRSVTLSF